MRRMYKKDGIYIPKKRVSLEVAGVIFGLGRPVYRKKDGTDGRDTEDVRKMRRFTNRDATFEEASKGLDGLYVDIA